MGGWAQGAGVFRFHNPAYFHCSGLIQLEYIDYSCFVFAICGDMLIPIFDEDILHNIGGNAFKIAIELSKYNKEFIYSVVY